MNEPSYKTEWWEGREVLPGDQMRFVAQPNTPKPIRMAVPSIGGDIAPLFDRDRAGKLKRPRPHRPTPESYTVADQLTDKLGGKREFGKLLDSLQTRLKKPRKRRKS